MNSPLLWSDRKRWVWAVVPPAPTSRACCAAQMEQRNRIEARGINFPRRSLRKDQAMNYATCHPPGFVAVAAGHGSAAAVGRAIGGGMPRNVQRCGHRQ
jgi:hypothetical protein